MALRQAVLPQAVDHRRAQPQKTQLVGNGGLGLPQLLRRLLLGQAVPPDEPGDGRRLLHVVQIPALEVLDQRQQRRVLLPHLGDEAGNLPQSGDAGGAETALPRHQLVDAAPVPHGQGLQNPVGADAVRQLPQRRLVEAAPGLLGVGTHRVDGDIANAAGQEFPLLVLLHAPPLLLSSLRQENCEIGQKLSGNSKNSQGRKKRRPQASFLRPYCRSRFRRRISSPKNGRISYSPSSLDSTDRP